ncbi:hybrid sensor histidine kinase/response regulator [Crocosphaera sp. Alani8]|uniref:hybrid sensor histidine kinase/response regulator n=1 Tax=Crocosphaera sp. Alani8 TaxID=3038952 RepID=UPI00313DC2D5
MKFELDDVTLAEMTQEARQCFLDEDAPEYLSILKIEVEKGYENADFTELLRAAHSLKGGAGMAQLSSIMELSHGFEDILAIFQKHPNERTKEGWELLTSVVTEITILLHQADEEKEIFIDAQLSKKIANFLDFYSAKNTNYVPENAPYTRQLKSEIDTENNNISNHAENSLSSLNLRISSERLDIMTNKVEELLVIRERLRLRQEQLSQVTRKIRSISRQLEPIQEQVQNFYNQLAIAPTSIALNHQEDFDSLELDQYTEIHSSLQSFQELMLQFQENYADLNLINQDVSDNLDGFETNIDSLYNNVTECRLVPFKTIAQRFLPQVQSVAIRSNKLVNLSIQGENVLIDKILLEQLQVPLSHLINNALSHGIELTSERLAHNKSENATIQLSASIENHQLTIIVQDDGQGIDLYKVYQKAKDQDLISSKLTFDKLSQESILEWIFHPHFSTIDIASELAGRGVGLDIVRNKIQKLRGTIEVTSEENKGTTFTINIPLNINFMSLFLIRWQHRLLAIPTSSVIETIPVSELVWQKPNYSRVKWRNKSIPVLHLSKLLSDKNNCDLSVKSQVAIILESSSHPFLVMVDNLLSEEKLLVKSFDETVTLPTYLLGCTILGGGEIVPVISPQAFTVFSETESNLLSQQNRLKSFDRKGTILVAEDSVATRRLLGRILEKVGFNVIVCRDGQEAVEKLELHQGGVDLIISDIEMPRINGFELLEMLRSQPEYSEIPIIIASSRTASRHQEQGKELGANAYLGKPILAKTLLKTIESFITIE